ncbi:uncharacterized protein LOC126291418 isoform X14 [Schistocerca gregaria]|uniref:uncharacterized protein LOC126291418 isoform X14 n=1 Tax=Schistocerca gregaria TaxID=7010 RepID=UPI00211F1746|nr:uncharacterized protein LOC126291418 isoform X14 [Schistocerca gregaria]
MSSMLHYECTEEVEAAAECAEMKDIEEPVLTYPHHQPPEEIEQIFIKEENQLETPEHPDTCDPLELERDEVVSEEETISPPDASHIKKEPWTSEERSEDYTIEPSSQPRKEAKIINVLSSPVRRTTTELMAVAVQLVEWTCLQEWAPHNVPHCRKHALSVMVVHVVLCRAAPPSRRHLHVRSTKTWTDAKFRIRAAFVTKHSQVVST